MSTSTQKFISLKIDVTKIVKEHMYYSKRPNPKNGNKCPVYLDCVVFANKDGEDDFGHTHYVVQSVGKEARAKGDKGPILGNMTMPGSSAPTAAPKPKAKAPAADAEDPSEEETGLPF